MCVPVRHCESLSVCANLNVTVKCGAPLRVYVKLGASLRVYVGLCEFVCVC